MHGLTPDTAGLEHVCLVDRADLLSALHRHLKRTAADAFDLVHRIVHIVCAGLSPALFAFTAVVLAEVHITGQLTANQNIKPLANDFGFDWAGSRQRLVHLRRAQVDKQSKRRAQTEQRLFRTFFRRDFVPFGAADRAEQHRIRVFTNLNGLLGQGNPVCINRAATREHFLIVEGMAELFTDCIEHLHRFGHDLRPNAVPLDDCDIVFHPAHSPLSLSDFSRPPALMMLWMNGGNAAA